jgi:dephospho-CoA kinase
MERSFSGRGSDAMKTLATNDRNMAIMLFSYEYSYCRNKKRCNMNTDKIVVGLAGMPGSGKSLVVETARAEGYAVVVMGDVVRAETQKRGLKPTPKNIGKVMLELRKKGGNSIIAVKCISKVEQQESEKVIVDGLRSLSEVATFKTHFPKFSLMAVLASPETRFNRLYRRRRSDDSDEWELFHERDIRELSVGLGNAIAMAEHLIINENGRDVTKTKVKKILRRIEKE